MKALAISALLAVLACPCLALGQSYTGGSGSSGGLSGGMSSGGIGTTSSGSSGFLGGGSSGGGGSGFLGTGGLTSGSGSSFLTSGNAPGSLGQAAKAGNRNASAAGDLMGPFYVNPIGLGMISGTSTTTHNFGMPLYSSLYPGTNVATALGTTTTSGITGSIGTGRAGVGGFGGLGGFAPAGTGIGLGNRPIAAYTTAIGFKYKPTTTSQLQNELRSVIARSSDLSANGNIHITVDGQ